VNALVIPSGFQTPTPTDVFIWLGWFFGLCGIFGVLRQPKAAFVATDHSKLQWFFIEFFGTVILLGVFVWLAFAIAIRPGLIKAGGKRRLWVGALRGLNEVILESQTASRSRPAPKQFDSSSAWIPAPAPEDCPNCAGSNWGQGRIACHYCNGVGFLGDTRQDSLCPNCYGVQWVNCNGCGGSGIKH
jgi:hypothetical protein